MNILVNAEIMADEKMSDKYNSLTKVICYLLVMYCVLIRCYLYFYHKDLWLDESYIADALYEVSWSDLFSGRLPRVQSCPLFFAVVNKLLSEVTNYSPYVLYFLPTVAGIVTTFLIYHFGMKLYGCMFTACCLTIFALMYMHLYYSSEFKPYIFDFLFTIVLFGNLFVDLRKTQVTCISIFLSKKYPLLFAVSWLCSSTAIICAASVGITIFIYLCLNRKLALTAIILKLIKIYWLFVIFAGIYYVFYLKQGASNRMYVDWKAGFIPAHLSEIPQWFNLTLKSVYYGLTTNIYGHILSHTIFGLAICGFLTVFFVQKYEFIAFAVLFILIFALATKIYPIGLSGGFIAARLSFYVLPVFIFLAAHGIWSIVNIWCRYQFRFKLFILMLIFTVALFGVTQSGVRYFKNRIHHQETSQMYKMVSEQYNESTDLIVVNHWAEPSFKYWKIYNSQIDKLPFVSISSYKLISLKDDLFVLIGKHNYESKKRIFFLFSHLINPKLKNNVMNYFKNHGFPVREFRWPGALMLIIDIGKH